MHLTMSEALAVQELAAKELRRRDLTEPYRQALMRASTAGHFQLTKGEMRAVRIAGENAMGSAMARNLELPPMAAHLTERIDEILPWHGLNLEREENFDEE